MDEERLVLLEDIARIRYPSLFVSFNHPLDELGLQGVLADIVVAVSPSMDAEHIVAVGLVAQAGGQLRPLPDRWVKVLDGSRDRLWRVHLHVPRGAVAGAKRFVNGRWPWARVFPLP